MDNYIKYQKNLQSELKRINQAFKAVKKEATNRLLPFFIDQQNNNYKDINYQV